MRGASCRAGARRQKVGRGARATLQRRQRLQHLGRLLWCWAATGSAAHRMRPAQTHVVMQYIGHL